MHEESMHTELREDGDMEDCVHQVGMKRGGSRKVCASAVAPPP